MQEIFVAKLTIVQYPDPRLKTVAKPVTEFNDELRQLAADMAQTMYEAPGVGLAATQVDRHICLITIDTSEEKNKLITLVNPEIVWTSEESREFEEGCLSLPEIYDKITRPARVKVKAQDLDGNWFELEAEGLLATCVQHEMDHLKGKVFADYLSKFKQDRIKAKLHKRRVEKAREAKREARS